MAQIFPIDFDEKLTIAQDDFILFSDSEDWNKIKKAQYSNLKWEKWDTGATWPQWIQWETWPQWPQGIQGIQWETWPKWDTWETWATWARINSAEFSGNDIVFWETDWNTVTLENAKTILTWPQGEQWEQGIQWPQGETWPKGDTWSKWDKWDKGDTGTAATITVWTTTTSTPWGDASVVNSWTSSAAVLDFTIPRGEQWPQWIQGIQGVQWPQWEQWIQGETWETWPQWPTGATGNGISSITSSKAWKTTTVTITETSWNVDTFQIQDWQDWEWAWDVLWPSSSVNGNVVLFDWTTGKLIKDSWKAFTAAGIWALADSTKYWKTLDLSIDSTTYVVTATLKDQDWTTLSTDTIDLPLESVVVWGSYDAVNKKVVLTLENGNTVEFSVADLVAWLQSEITSSNKLDADLVDDSTSTNKFVTAANKTTWNWKQDALIAWTNITIAADWKTISATDTTYSSATSSTLWLVKLWDDTVQSVAANAVTGTASRTYAMQVNSSGQLVVNVPRTDTTYESKTAASWGTDVSLVTTWEKYTWNNKQNALSSQTAYTTKGTSTKVATISTNNLGQVTAITETSIDFPVTSVNGGTGAVTVNEFNPWGTATTWYVLKKTANWYWWDAESWAVTSVNWQTGAVTVSEFTPTSSGSTDQVLTKTANWYDWATPAASGIICDPNSPITITKIRCWTEAQYSALSTKDSSTAYLTV